MGGARGIAKRASRFAEFVLAMLLAVMFLAFVAQIAFRYLLNFPIGWTSELTVIMWLWMVLWGAAFVVTAAEEIRFDLIYGGAPEDQPEPGDHRDLGGPADREVEEVAEDDLRHEGEEHDGKEHCRHELREAVEPLRDRPPPVHRLRRRGR